MTEISRYSAVDTATIALNESESNVIEVGKFSGGSIKLEGSAWTAADITIKWAESPNGTFDFLRDDTGSLKRLTNIPTGSVFTRPLPTELFGVPYIKLVSTNTASEVAVTQGAARNFIIVLKG